MTDKAQASPVVLASSSRYRQALLSRLLGTFECISPAVDESPQPGEAAADRARRLAALKAVAGAKARPRAIVIGSDQVAALGGEILRKPKSQAVAEAQLEACNGRQVVFHTAVSLITGDDHYHHLDSTWVRFRQTSAQVRQDYLHHEQPYDCAGSFKSEGLGVVLLEEIDSRDPTALQGLPLIWLADRLRSLGILLPPDP